MALSRHAYICPHHIPQAAARREMLAAEILVLLDMNDSNPGLQVPAKLFDYARAGRPILALTRPGSATERVLAIAAVPHVYIDVCTPAPAFDRAVAAFLTASHVSIPPSVRIQRDFSAETQVDTPIRLLDAVSRGAGVEGLIRVCFSRFLAAF